MNNVNVRAKVSARSNFLSGLAQVQMQVQMRGVITPTNHLFLKEKRGKHGAGRYFFQKRMADNAAQQVFWKKRIAEHSTRPYFSFSRGAENRF